MDSLTKLVKQKRKVETKVTKDNKGQIIKEINKNMDSFGYGKIPMNSSVATVNRMKKQYMERLTYDIVALAIQQGKDIVAEIEGRDLKKSSEYDYKRLGQFAKELAIAKKETSRNLTKEQKQFLERGNNNIKGFGNNDILTLFENTKNEKQAKELIEQVKKQNAKEVFYSKQTELLDNVFNKIGIVREDDLKLIKEKMRNMEFDKAVHYSDYLLQGLTLFESGDTGQANTSNVEDETELSNARLDDLMIQFGLKKDGIKKVQKTLNKYKTQYNSKNGFIYE